MRLSYSVDCVLRYYLIISNDMGFKIYVLVILDLCVLKVFALRKVLLHIVLKLPFKKKKTSSPSCESAH